MAMIDFKTILSTFNEKGTLLKWLQKLEKALTTSVLKSVTTTSTGGAAVFSFNFADGTAIETPPVPLPKGDKGADGQNGVDGVGILSIEEGTPTQAGGYTETPLTVKLTDGTPAKIFTISAKNGADGQNGVDGVGILSIEEGTPTQAGGYTETPLTVKLTDGTPAKIFTISAKNGADGQNGADGVGIETVHALRHYTQEGETITICEAVFSNGETSQFEVHAQNGTGKYTAYIVLQGTREEGVATIFFALSVDTKDELTIQEIANLIKDTLMPASGVYINNNINTISTYSDENGQVVGFYIRYGTTNEEEDFEIENISVLQYQVI